MADLPISSLPELSSDGIQTVDELVIVDASASETKKIKGANFIVGLITEIPDGSIPKEKVDNEIGEGAIDTFQIADKSITAAKLADESTGFYFASADDSPPVQVGRYTGQICIAGTRLYMWTGGQWFGIGSVAASDFISLNDPRIESEFSQLDNGIGLSIRLKPTGGPAEFLAGPTSAAGDVFSRIIVGDDLPIAGEQEVGAVRVTGGGLAMQGDVVVINNTVEPLVDAGLVEYNAFGLVTSARAIESIDLPVATPTTLGAVKVGFGLVIDANGELTVSDDVGGGGGGDLATDLAPGIVQPGGGLSIDPNGVLSVDNGMPPFEIDEDGNTSGFVPGTSPKVSYNEYGLVTGGFALTAEDIPELDASQISTGVINSARIEDASITRAKLADQAVCFISESEPTIGTEGSRGGFWFKESTGILRCWNTNRWVPVNGNAGGSGAGVLRFAGFFDASTGLVAQLTELGAGLPLTVGSELPTVTAEIVGAYLIAAPGGSGTSVLPGEEFVAGDQIVAVSITDGWIRVETGNAGGGGGGGGIDRLNNLLDVDLTNPGQGQILIWDAATGFWRNASEIDANDGHVELRLQRSNQENLQPDAATLPEGELFLNFNENTPGLWFKDSTGALQSITPTQTEGVEQIFVSGGALTVSNNGGDWTLGLPAATSSVTGSMSSGDKTKLDGIPADAAPGTVLSFTPQLPLELTEASTDTDIILRVNDVTQQANGVMSYLDKIKLDGLFNGAKPNVQSDWAASDNLSDAYILNKPVNATIDVDGFMSAADKSKLDGIPPGGGTSGEVTEAPINGNQYARKDGSWSEVEQFDEAPSDGKQYARKDETWAEIVIPPSGLSDAPVDGFQYARENASWQRVDNGASVTVGSLPPSAPNEGDQWLDIDTAQLYVFAEDGGGSDQWINVAKQGPQGPPGGIAYLTETPPSAPSEGAVWIRPSNMKQYVYMTDSGGSSQWASVACC